MRSIASMGNGRPKFYIRAHMKFIFAIIAVALLAPEAMAAPSTDIDNAYIGGCVWPRNDETGLQFMKRCPPKKRDSDIDNAYIGGCVWPRSDETGLEFMKRCPPKKRDSSIDDAYIGGCVWPRSDETGLEFMKRCPPKMVRV
ncbi:hypothetical protein PILCRDRAFT_13821 [Piloderma croceum F 1598]|uniref:Secreted protein n=1 Tax=Piloderma croceum (strain F 1598) TaxID=765440 RepID=A0A0C3AMN2_PILCF|nr:hypothetical protein PILCRDRAFT_13821 [Piloderma croceum F 1598]